jgi:indolepyruvate ferredoxin oxidoreductase
MEMLPIGLDDKFNVVERSVLITGTQALVRLCLLRAELDKRAGLNTAGYVSGYRGSPLGGVDGQFLGAEKHLTKANVIFESGLNEDIAATAIWGTQQAEMRGDGKFDGVFGMWYAKGPGVDRTGDVFRHANLAGTSKYGGVLAVLGDDHTCESSTTCHQSEFAMVDAMMPVLSPSTVQDLIEYGLHGWQLSRFSGQWVGLKCVKDVVEATATITSDIDAFNPIIPNIDTMPVDGLNIRPFDIPVAQEKRLHKHKVGAAIAYSRANNLNKSTYTGGKTPRIGIISTGKSYMDVLQSLHILGIDEQLANTLGIAVYKVGMVYPLDPQGIREFAKTLDQVIVVEEKRGILETQVREILYGVENQPNVIGKRDENEAVLFQSEFALNPKQIAQAIGERVFAKTKDETVGNAVKTLTASLDEERLELKVARKPYFCAGCPHNTSTVIPDGARGYAGIGCHWMVQSMDRNTEGYTHMGGEGANWIGESKFSNRRHVFQNLGDGTYNHSGILALRAAVASNVNITYKILYNDAVAMTGGQAHDGDLSPQSIAAEVVAAGAKKITFMSDRPELYSKSDFPSGTTISHRDDLIPVQEELAKWDGVTVLLYEQTCATEKRRRRKRGLLDEPKEHLYINPDVCEGCGDCGVQSNCVAITPLETPNGRKRKIDQSACNKDFSCVKGFCPSFVTVKGGELRKPAPIETSLPQLIEPKSTVDLNNGPYAIAITGVGGTGVVTIAAILGMAAHLEGKGSGSVDMAGLAQKGGAVTSHIAIAQNPHDIKTIRIPPGGADLVLGCDIVVSAGDPLLDTVKKGRTKMVINLAEMTTGDFIKDTEFTLPIDLMRKRLTMAVNPNAAFFADATRIATKLMGNSIAANMFMLGLAYQLGLLPLGHQSIHRALELNNVQITFNKRAFEWGRIWVQDPKFILSALGELFAQDHVETLSEKIARHTASLTDYQNAAYAQRYTDLVSIAFRADTHGDKSLASTVADCCFKLMAYKDEYEVARLYSLPSFRAGLDAQFEGEAKLTIHLAPPLLSKRNPTTGVPVKRTFGPWVFTAMRLLAKGKVLRGSIFDIFGKSAERKMERKLVQDYFELATDLCENLTDERYDASVKTLNLARNLRGFGHVKEENFQQYQHDLKSHLKAMRDPTTEQEESNLESA